MNSRRLLLLSILTGVLSALSWPNIGISPLIFVAWVPLLIVGETLFLKGASHLKIFGHAYLAFLIWNVGATWWIVNASLEGALMAFLANSLLMAIVFTLYYILRRQIPSSYPGFILCALWIGFENFHHFWHLSWPWLTIGNVFAANYQLVQWYEFTGTEGGTLWVLLINLGILSIIKKHLASQPLKPLIRGIALGLFIPAALSLALYYSTSDKGELTEMVIVQPNVDPYEEKFDRSSLDAQFDRFFALAASTVTAKTEWLLGPETALVGSIDESNLENDIRINRMRDWRAPYPNLNILIGAETHKFYKSWDDLPSSVRRGGANNEIIYDSYNTALLLNNSIAVYHKSKLVPGVEQMPFPALFGMLGNLAIDLGGTTGTLGTQEERTVFTGINTSQKAAPSICYESIYGDFMRRYIADGANFIAIITNDGWWGETPGYRQHLNYARLRAIENRRSVARSANTGVSCFINQRGDIQQQLPYWKAGTLKQSVALNNSLTIFSITGDAIGRSSLYFSGLLILLAVFLKFKRKSKGNLSSK